MFHTDDPQILRVTIEFSNQGDLATGMCTLALYNTTHSTLLSEYSSELTLAYNITK